MSNRNATWWRAAVVLASAAAFTRCLIEIAFVTECCYVVGDTRALSGLATLVIGWGGVLGSSLHPVLFLSIIGAWLSVCIGSRFGAVVGAFCAFVVVAAFPGTVLPQVGYVAWLANPIIVSAWFLYLAGKRPAALISAVSALGLTLTFLRVTDVPLSDKLTPVEIISYGTGYWLWIGSAGCLVVGVSIDLFLSCFNRVRSSASFRYLDPSMHSSWPHEIFKPLRDRRHMRVLN
jgi:hypothetical protein